MRYILSFFMLFLINSCKSQNQENKLEIALKKCVNEGVNKDIEAAYGKPPFDFYDLMLDFEKKMINSNDLEKNDKQGFQDLLFSIINNTKNYNKLYRQLNEQSNSVGFGYTIYSVSNPILVNCPYQVFFTNNDTSHPFIKEYIIRMNKLEAKSYKDKELIKGLFELLDEESFDNIVYRAPIMLLVMINLDNKYNEDLKKYKESIKGKKPIHKN